VTRRDECHTTISALFSDAALEVCLDRPSRRSIHATGGSVKRRRCSGDESVCGAGNGVLMWKL